MSELKLDLDDVSSAFVTTSPGDNAATAVDPVTNASTPAATVASPQQFPNLAADPTASGAMPLNMGAFDGLAMRDTAATTGSLAMGSQKKRQVALGGILAIMIVGLGAIHFAGPSDDPLANIEAFVFGDDTDLMQLPPLPQNRAKANKRPRPQKPSAAIAAATSQTGPESEAFTPLASEQGLEGAETPAADAMSEVLRNPYWYLPNQLQATPFAAADGEPPKAMTGAQEEVFRAGMRHLYNYQAYKAVTTIRRLRAKGAEVILFEALNHKRFWIRMEALLGLAEYGFPVEIDSVIAAFDGVRPSLVKNYLKRLQQRPTPGELFVARQAIKVVGAPGRLQVLKALRHAGWRGNRMYLAAAVYDPSPLVQAWLAEELAEHPLSGRHLADYRAIVMSEYQKTLKAKRVAKVIKVKDYDTTSEVRRLRYFKEKPPEQKSLPEFHEVDLESQFDDGFGDINGYSETVTPATSRRQP